MPKKATEDQTIVGLREYVLPVTGRFLDEALATTPPNLEALAYVGQKAPGGAIPDDEAAAHAQTLLDQARGEEEVKEFAPPTIFLKESGKPIVFNYIIKGFFKAACSALGYVNGKECSLSSTLQAHLKKIDGLIFINPRKIVLNIPDGLGLGMCTRPLRCKTAQGERVTIASSETVPEGTSFNFEVVMLGSSLEPFVREWLAYGKYRGLLQWRNSGKGRCEFSVGALTTRG